MTPRLYSLDDWFRWTGRSVVAIIAVSLLVFFMATLCVWAYHLTAEPQLSQNTTQVFGNPRSAGDWLLLAAWFGFLAAMATFFAGTAIAIMLACTVLVVQGVRARSISRMPLATLVERSRSPGRKEI